jgi:hypothetical protein
MRPSSTIVDTIEATRAVRVVAPHLGTRATLVEPNDAGYLLLAAQTGRWPVLVPRSRARQALIRASRAAATTLRAAADVTDVAVFEAIFSPPGRGAFLERRPDEAPSARFDLVVLLKATSRQAADRLQATDAWQSLVHRAHATARHAIAIGATNVRRMGDVDHTRDGVFLFNFFFADDVDQNIAVWEHTAGWWQQETGLDNSEVLLPAPGSSAHSIINHCRWDSLAALVPHLAFNRGFRSHVLDTFDANDVAPIPILYRLV